MLKGLEGTAKFLLKELKKVFLSSTKTKLAAAMVKGELGGLKKALDPGETGGTPFLGNLPACDQGPRFFRCPGAEQRGAAGQGVCRERIHLGYRGQHRFVRVDGRQKKCNPLDRGAALAV